MNNLIINDFVIHIFMLGFMCTVILVFTNNYIRYLGQRKKLKLLFKKMEEQQKTTSQQKILAEHLSKTVEWFSKPENTILKCPGGTTCKTAQNICNIAQDALYKIEQKKENIL